MNSSRPQEVPSTLFSSLTVCGGMVLTFTPRLWRARVLFPIIAGLNYSPFLKNYPATLQNSVIRQLWWMLVYLVFFEHSFIYCVGMCVGTHPPWCVRGGQRTELAGVDFLFLPCGSQALNSGSLGLATSSFTHGAILPAQMFGYYNKILNYTQENKEGPSSLSLRTKASE